MNLWRFAMKEKLNSMKKRTNCQEVKHELRRRAMEREPWMNNVANCGIVVKREMYMKRKDTENIHCINYYMSYLEKYNFTYTITIHFPSIWICHEYHQYIIFNQTTVLVVEIWFIISCISLSWVRKLDWDGCKSRAVLAYSTSRREGGGSGTSFIASSTSSDTAFMCSVWFEPSGWCSSPVLRIARWALRNITSWHYSKFDLLLPSCSSLWDCA